MAPEFEQLFDLSGITIALTGFSALFSVVGATRSASHIVVDRMRVLLLIQCGLVVNAIVLLPAVLVNFFEPASAWYYSSIAALVSTLIMLIWCLVWVWRYLSVFTLMDKAITLATFILALGMTSLFAGIVANLQHGNFAGHYVLAIYLSILILSLFFVGVATSILMPAIAAGVDDD